MDSRLLMILDENYDEKRKVMNKKKSFFNKQTQFWIERGDNWWVEESTISLVKSFHLLISLLMYISPPLHNEYVHEWYFLVLIFSFTKYVHVIYHFPKYQNLKLCPHFNTAFFLTTVTKSYSFSKTLFFLPHCLLSFL